MELVSSGEGDHGLFEIQLTGPGGRPLLEEEGEVTAEDSIMAMACEAVQTMDEFKDDPAPYYLEVAPSTPASGRET